MSWWASATRVICLGDVTVDDSVQAHHQRWWREAPGEKWLVLDNHDVDHTEALQQAGFAEECTAALCCYRLASGVCRLHGGSTPRLPVSRSKALRRVGARDRDGSKRSDGLEPTE